MKKSLGKRCLLALLVGMAASLLACEAAAQNKTIVLVRHMERADDGAMASGDPDLSAAGKERAARLVKLVKKYKPHEIYSTDFKRTRQSVEPIAAYRHKEVQIYDPAKAPDLITKMMASKTEHYLIVGHSNTIPVLANLLMSKEVFRNLVDTEYGVIWVVKIRDGKFKKVEVLSY